jgi:hypothetical protein
MNKGVLVRKILSLVCVVALTASLPGCGVIFGGTRQAVQVTSAPDGAKVTTQPPTTEYATPTSLSLERKNNYTLTFAKEGYKPATAEVQKSMRTGILVLDILFTGLLGVIVDAATGGWYRLGPENVTVSLTKLSADVAGPDRIDVTLRTTREDGRGAEVAVDSTAPGVTVTVETK